MPHPSPWKIILTVVVLLLTALLLWPTLAQSAPAAAATVAAATRTYPIVDTGQVRCYDANAEVACPPTGAAFYGQDAQTTANAPSYTNNGNGTVTDNVTGVMWQRSADLNGDGNIQASDKLTYTATLTYCADLTLGGHSDWRLPDIKQLYSLIVFSGTDPSGYTGTNTSGLTPFIDATAFVFAYGDLAAGERLIDAQYASSTRYVANTANDGGNTLFGVNFADGRIKGYGLAMPGQPGQEKTFFVKCARGNTSYGVNALVDNGDQTITDNATGLMWAKADNGTTLNWQEALAWVQTQNAANYLGHNDWRLPNAKELQSILDYTRSPSTTSSAALNPLFTATAFNNEGGQTDWPWYWASTTHATYNGMGGAAVYVAFGRAGGWQKVPPTATCYTLLDVHGAGAQRSDPKTPAGRAIIGTACVGGTAYGLGPQGDAQRGANYVRLVRSVAEVVYKVYGPGVANGE